MNLKKIIPAVAIAMTISACGNIEWFPEDDIFAPIVTATVASNSDPGTSKQLFANRTTHVSSYPATVTFSSSEPATIYYTTNGSEPTNASASANSVTGPWPEIIADITLWFFGEDAKNNPSSKIKTYIKSP